MKYLFTIYFIKPKPSFFNKKFSMYFSSCKHVDNLMEGKIAHTTET